MTPRTHSRRQLLQVGGISVLGLGLPELLRASAPQAAVHKGTARSCIFIVQYGGASHIDSLDPKPDAPDKISGPYKPIASRVPGIQVCEHLPPLASNPDRLPLVPSKHQRQ